MPSVVSLPPLSECQVAGTPFNNCSLMTSMPTACFMHTFMWTSLFAAANLSGRLSKMSALAGSSADTCQQHQCKGMLLSAEDIQHSGQQTILVNAAVEQLFQQQNSMNNGCDCSLASHEYLPARVLQRNIIVTCSAPQIPNGSRARLMHT